MVDKLIGDKMINILYKEKDNDIHHYNDALLPETYDRDIFTWIELFNPTMEDLSFVERMYEVQLEDLHDMRESQYEGHLLRTGNQITLRYPFLVLTKEETVEVTYTLIIMRTNLIITVCYNHRPVLSFNGAKMDWFKNIKSSYDFMLNLLEEEFTKDANVLDNISKDNSLIGKSVTLEKHLDENVFIGINECQDIILTLRRCITEKQRLISLILRTGRMESDHSTHFRTLGHDLKILLDDSNFHFERLEYMQNTFLGLVGLEQNKVIKIFTVATVIFMPPTLIASLYGMNFKYLPELNWQYGYAFAIGLMLISSLGTLGYFKNKKWL